MCAAAAIACLLQSCIAFADVNITYILLPRPVIEARLGQYAGDDKQREATLKKMFTESGCGAEDLSEQPVKGSTLPNLICVLPGDSEKTIIIGAHFDHVPAGNGVVDNWSGAALLPSLYQSVKSAERTHTYIFIAFTDEERGQVGSRYYARRMTKQQVANTDAMVNIEALGLAPAEVWASHSDNRLIGNLLYVAHLLEMTVAGVDVQSSGSTDSEQFGDRHIPRITIHSLTQQAWEDRILHTAKDNLVAVQLDDYYKSYSLLAPYVAFLDQSKDIEAQPLDQKKSQPRLQPQGAPRGVFLPLP